MAGLTHLTPAQAALAFCPLVQGACKAGGCHFWLWDTRRSSKHLPWPQGIDRPNMQKLRDSHWNPLPLTNVELGQQFAETVRGALEPIIGREMDGGVVVDVGAVDLKLRDIRVTIEQRETGDCCMRRAAQGAKT